MGTAHAEPGSAMPALTKAQLADVLADEVGLNKRVSKDVVEAFFDAITEQLSAGTDVKISGFGHFYIRSKSPRPGRNPRTGEAVAIEARRVVTFHASPKLKDQVQGGFSPERNRSPRWAG